MGTRADHVTPLYPQMLALSSPTGGGRSVGIVRSRTKATEFVSSCFGWCFLLCTFRPPTVSRCVFGGTDVLSVGRELGSAGPQFNNCARGSLCRPRDPEGSTEEILWAVRLKMFTSPDVLPSIPDTCVFQSTVLLPTKFVPLSLPELLLCTEWLKQLEGEVVGLTP